MPPEVTSRGQSLFVPVPVSPIGHLVGVNFLLKLRGSPLCQRNASKRLANSVGGKDRPVQFTSELLATVLLPVPTRPMTTKSKGCEPAIA